MLFDYVFLVLLIALILILKHRTLINFILHFISFGIRSNDLYFGLKVNPIVLGAHATPWASGLVQVCGERIGEAGVDCSSIDLGLVH